MLAVNGGSEGVKQLQGFTEHSNKEEEISKEKIKSYTLDLFSYYRARDALEKLPLQVREVWLGWPAVQGANY